MTNHYKTLPSPAGMLDLLEDRENGIRITVNRLGAEVISLARRDDQGVWHGFLWRDGMHEAPESGWSNHATVMGYYTHRLWEGKSIYAGHPIDGGATPHGFLRHHVFSSPRVDLSLGSLSYHIEPDQIPLGAYPYAVAATISYTLTEGGVKMTFLFENRESHPVALSFGWHPGFAVGSIESARLLLPSGTYRQQTAKENFLTGQVEEIVFAGGEMPYPKKNLVDSYLIDLSGVPNRQFVLEDSQIGHRVECDYSEAPFLTIWSNGDPFLCVEPCWGLPDSNPPFPFELKKGIQHIDAGGKLMASATIVPSFLT